MGSLLRILAILAGVVLLTACGDDDDVVAAGDDPGAADGAALAEEYLSTEVSDAGGPRALADGTQILLRFGADRLSAHAGCNHLDGRYEIDGDMLVVDGLGGTEMGCPPELHAQDEWLSDLLASRPTVAVEGDELTLTSGETVVRLLDRQVAEPDAALVGTTWEVDGFADGEGGDDTATSFAVERPATVRFEENGYVTGSDGCNGFGFGGSDGEMADGLAYEVQGDRVAFTGDPVTELQACPDLAQYVDRFWSALTGTAQWSIDGDRLRLVGEDGRVVTLRAAAGG